MKDIDFDELDKAVNSLMATTPQPAVPTTPVPSVAPTQAVNAQPAVSAPAPVTSEAVPVTVSQPVPVVTRPVAPAARRGGRFMDMVHTSSDMKPRDAAMATNSREGVTITPRSEQLDTLSPTASSPQAPEPTVESTPAVMPDPIDVTFGSQPDITAVEAEPAAAPAEPVAAPMQESMPSAPIESPFLTDAKVEKRPLNAGTPDAPEAVDFGAEMDSLHDSDNTPEEETSNQQAAKSDEPPVSPQIPELSSDLVAIESSEKVATQAVETSDAVSQVDVPAVPLGASSIAQQYTTQASTGDQSHAAIYDASQYPEPVTHPAKHKSGWLWVLWVVLLLGVGAGGAVLLYTFGIIP